MNTRKLSRRMFLRAGCAACAGGILCACGPQATAPEPSAAKPPEVGKVEAKPAAKEETVTLAMMPGYFLGEGREPLTEDYRRTFDAAGLEWISWERDNVSGTALDARMAAGDAPDLLYTYPALTLPWAYREQVVDLQPAIDSDPTWQKDIDTFIPGMLDGHRYNGDLYAVVTGAEAECIVYNPAHFKKMGVPTPAEVGEEAFTLEKLAEMAKAVTEEGMYGFEAGTTFNGGFGDILYAYGGRYFSADGTEALMNSAEFVATVDYLTALVKEGSARNGIQATRDGVGLWQGLTQDMIASLIAGDWAYGHSVRTLKETGKDWQVELFVIPKGPAGRSPVAHSKGHTIFSGTKHLDAAMQWMRFSFTKEFQQVQDRNYGIAPCFPGRVDATGVIFDQKLLPANFVDLFEGGVEAPASPLLSWYPLQGMLSDAVDLIWKGTDRRPTQIILDALNERAQTELDFAAE